MSKTRGFPPTKRYLKELEAKAVWGSDWLKCARQWMIMFGDATQVRRCLIKAERKVDAPWWEEEDEADWCKAYQECAQAWKELLKDDNETRRCLKQAENAAQESDDWAYCAESRKELFSYEESESIACLKKAEETAENRSHWEECATLWKELFHNNAEAERCQRMAERMQE